MTPAWERVAACYAGVAKEHGVAADRRALEEFVAFRRLRAAEYGEAAAAYRRLGKGPLAKVVRCAGPLWTWLQTERGRRSVPAPWRKEADAWLAEVPQPSD